ncbi:MAG: hypothetical protein AAGC58_06480 [Asticcacaulis sp.]
MRQHSQIIEDAGGYSAFAKQLGLEVNRVRFWRARSSIPAQYWIRVCAAGFSDLVELAQAVAEDGLDIPSDNPPAADTDTRNGAAVSGQPAGETAQTGGAG